jgi:hypothetical protein
MFCESRDVGPPRIHVIWPDGPATCAPPITKFSSVLLPQREQVQQSNSQQLGEGEASTGGDLGGDDDLVARGPAGPQPAAEELLAAPAGLAALRDRVHLGGVEEVDPGVEGGVEEAQRARRPALLPHRHRPCTNRARTRAVSQRRSTSGREREGEEGS